MLDDEDIHDRASQESPSDLIHALLSASSHSSTAESTSGILSDIENALGERRQRVEDNSVIQDFLLASLELGGVTPTSDPCVSLKKRRWYSPEDADDMSDMSSTSWDEETSMFLPDSLCAGYLHRSGIQRSAVSITYIECDTAATLEDAQNEDYFIDDEEWESLSSEISAIQSLSW